ncbi:MAG: M48 family metalloprotease [Gemmatimonadaceae bacterium]|jgi:beta-barrel assembly-enhancing protease|nr:M48 family metalloprotease [Gemmatimonadaceae bacterium]
MRTLKVLAIAALVSGCAVSTQQEVEMGAGYAQQINKELPLIQDAELNRYINVLGDSIARIADSRNLDWQFFIVDSKDVNAFAVPGGFIYINRGLIERAQNLSQVAGVLGHEVGHVTMRHSVRQMQKAQGANVGLTAVCVLTNICNNELSNAAIGLGANAAFANFSRQDEDEADAEGVTYMVRAGIDPTGIPEMFQILLSERESKPGALDTWFRSHPLEESRIAAARARIAKLPPESLKGLTKDSPNFQAFKARIAALPPSPPSR